MAGSPESRLGQPTAGSLHDVAREKIKARILAGEFAAGAPLSEELIAAELKMSRTPVRQAFQELVSAGLLDRVPGRGVVVSRIDLHHVLDIFEVQQCLLEWAVERLCQHPGVDLAVVLEAYRRQLEAVERSDFATVRSHARRMDVALVAATGNREMERYMRGISDLLLHAASQALATRDVYEEAIREHGEIIDAIQACDVERAKRATRVHFEGMLRRLGGQRR